MNHYPINDLSIGLIGPIKCLRSTKMKCFYFIDDSARLKAYNYFIFSSQPYGEEVE